MNKACRALVRVNDKTPITIPELLKIHSKSKLLELVEKKKKDMDGRIMWRKGILCVDRRVSWSSLALRATCFRPHNLYAQVAAHIW